MTHSEQHEDRGKHEEPRDPFSAEKVFGIATLGAVGSLGLYFLYNSLAEETRKKVKERVVSGFKAAIRTQD